MSTKEELRTGRRVRNGKAQAVVPAEQPENPRDCWRTPRWIVREAASYCGGEFGLDVAADAENAVCHSTDDEHYDRVRDALSLPQWNSHNGRAWCNPPFSGGQLGRFVERGIAEMHAHNLEALALLVLADVSTGYWRKLEALQHGEVVRSLQLPIAGRWGLDPPPGVERSSPDRAMAVWVLRRVVRAPKPLKLIAELDQ